MSAPKVTTETTVTIDNLDDKRYFIVIVTWGVVNGRREVVSTISHIWYDDGVKRAEDE